MSSNVINKSISEMQEIYDELVKVLEQEERKSEMLENEYQREVQMESQLQQEIQVFESPHFISLNKLL